MIKCGAVGQTPCKSTPLRRYDNDSNLEVEAVRLGHGIALSRRSLVGAAIAAGSLVQITEIEVPYQYPYWLIWPEKSSASRKLADFSAWIIEQANDFVNGRDQ